MRFKGLDLNLLVALDTLLQEMNVTRAAARLNMTQSTMSGVLSRLRLHFKDDLLVSYGRTLHKTPLSEQLQGPLREAIVRIESLVAADGNFDPYNSVRYFKVEFPDHLIPVLLSEISARLQQFTPNITVEFSLPRGDPIPLLHRGELDLVVTPHSYKRDEYLSKSLLTDEMVIAGWQHNPALAGELTLDQLASLKAITVRFDPRRVSDSLTEAQLSIIEARGRIAMIAPTFSAIPGLLVGSHAISFLHRNLASEAAGRLPLVIKDLPFPPPTLRDVLLYHPTRADDKGLLWLIGQLADAAKAVQGCS